MQPRMRKILSILFTVTMLLQGAQSMPVLADDMAVQLLPAQEEAQPGEGARSPSVSPRLLNVQARPNGEGGRPFSIQWLPDASIAPQGGITVLATWEGGSQEKTLTAADNWGATFEDIPAGVTATYKIAALDRNEYYDFASANKDTIVVSKIAETGVEKYWYNVPEEYRQAIDVTVTMVSGEDNSSGGTGTVLGKITGLAGEGAGNQPIVMDDDVFRFPMYNSDGKRFHSFKVQELRLGGHLVNLDGEQKFLEGETIVLHNTMKRALRVTKYWAGNYDDGNTAVTVDLVRVNDDKVVDTLRIEKDKDGSWPTRAFAEVPLGGLVGGEYVPFTYKIVETGVYGSADPDKNLIDAYDVTYPSAPNWQTTGFSLRNTRKIDVESEIAIDIEKTWDDARVPGDRFAIFTITRLNGEDNWSKQVVITGDRNETVVKSLRYPKYNPLTGEAYIYHVQENTSDDFYIIPRGKETVGDKQIWRFENQSILRSVTVSKVWHDDDPAGRSAITLYLLRDGERMLDPISQEPISITLEPGETSYTFHNLPRFVAKGGREYVYTVQEDPVPAGYYKVEDGLTVENHLLALQEDPVILVTKRWNTAGKLYETLPEVTLQLYERVPGGEDIPIGDPMVMTAGTKLSQLFTIISGQGIVLDTEKAYYVQEVTDPEDRWTILGGDIIWTGNIGTETITNVLKKDIIERKPSYRSLIIRKYWTVTDAPAGFASVAAYIVTLPSSFEITQLIDGVAGPLSTEIEQTGGEGIFHGDGTVTILGNGYVLLRVPEYDAQGRHYTYRVTEPSMAGFRTTSFVSDTSFVFGNAEITTQISARKTWHNLAQRGDYEVPSVTLTLHRRIGNGPWQQVGEPKVISVFDMKGVGRDCYLEGMTAFGSFPTHGYSEGQFLPYEYKVTEDFDLTDEKYFETTGGEVEDGEAHIQNTYDRYNEKTRFTVNKDWMGGVKDEVYPSVTIELLDDTGKQIDVVTLDAKTGWSHTFRDLEKYRPAADGGEREEIVYSGKEIAIGGKLVDGEGSKVTITEGESSKMYRLEREYSMGSNDYYAVNSLVTLEIDMKYDIIGYKAWGNLPEGMAMPDSVTFVLLQDGKFYGRETFTKDDGWQCKFAQVEYFNEEAGRPYTYLLYEENPPAGFFPLILEAMEFDRDDNDELYAHATLINIPTEDREVTFVKAWEGGNKTLRVDADGNARVVLKLSYGGGTRDIVLTPDENDTWSATVRLPITTAVNGTEYVLYRIEEPALPYYTWKENRYQGGAIQEGQDNHQFRLSHSGENAVVTVVNKYNTAITVEGAKRWVDADNASHLRPTSLSVVLEAYVSREGQDVLIESTPMVIRTSDPGIRIETVEDGIYGSVTYWRWSHGAEGETEQGEPIFYKWRETIIPDHYTCTGDDQYSYIQDGAVKPITNRLEMVNITGQKIWRNVLDGTDYGEIHPQEALRIRLLRKGDGGAEEDTGRTASATAQSGWTWSFEGLPKHDADGKVYTYYVVEETVPRGYEATQRQSTAGETGIISDITNQILPGKVIIRKAWHGDGDGGDRTEIRYALRATIGGVPYSWPGVLTADKGWEDTVENLPIYDSTAANGRIQYTVHELDVPDGYTFVEPTADGLTPVEGPAQTAPAPIGEDGTVVFTLHNAKMITLEGQKEWVDASDAGNTRPKNAQGQSVLTVTLQRSAGQAYVDIGSKTFAGDGDAWTFTWPEQLPAGDDAGNAYTYRFVESVPVGYVCENEDNAIAADGSEALRNVLDVTEIHGEKTWNLTAEGLMPESIEITLKRRLPSTGAVETLETITVDGGQPNPWQWSWTGQQKVNGAGEAYEYFVEETPIPGFTTLRQGMNLTNTTRPGRITVQKEWIDQNAATRPNAPITITLEAYADAAATVLLFEREHTIENGVQTNWQYTFENLPLYRYTGGTAARIVYRVKESTVAGYTLRDVDAENSVPAVFMQDNVYETSVVLVNERLSRNFTVTKQWTGDALYWRYTRPSTLTFELVQYAADDSHVQTHTRTISQVQDGSWPQAVFEDMPLVDALGGAYRYELREMAVPGYRSEAEPVLADGELTGFVVTNTLQTLSIQIDKAWAEATHREEGDLRVWLYDRPDVVEAVLVGMAGGREVYRQTHTLRPEGWTVTVRDLPRYAYAADGQTGSLITYHVEEITLPAFTSKVDAGGMGPSETGNYRATIENALKTTDITVTKTFAGDVGSGVRPKTVTLHLYREVEGVRDDQFRMTKVLDVQGDDLSFTHTFAQLPLLNLEGKAYEYTVDEADVYGYTKQLSPDGRTVTNTLHTIRIYGEKRWVDGADAQGEFRTRPAEIVIRLTRSVGGVADESFVRETRIAYSKDRMQAWSFDNLPRGNAEGDTFDYHVEELAIPGYWSTQDMWEREDGFEYVIENTLKRLSIVVTKQWQDADYTGHRPADGLPIRLVGTGEDGVIYHDSTVLAKPSPQGAATWTATFENLPRYGRDGKVIRYAVSETLGEAYEQVSIVQPQVDSDESKETYTASIDNRLRTTSLSGEKTWANDADNRYRTRPESIEIALKRSYVDLLGRTQTETVETLTVRAPWRWQFENKPTHHETGAKYDYFVEETSPDKRYAVSYTGGDRMRLTNTLHTQDIVVTKVWEDAENRYQMRPGSVTVSLLSSTGVRYTGAVTIANNWQFTFRALPKYAADGELVTYTLSETVPAGYRIRGEIVQPVPGAATTYTASVTNELIATEVSVQKQWAGIPAGANLPEVTVRLLENGRAVSSVVLGSHNQWQHTFTGLPTVRNGVALQYTVEEIAVAGFTTTVQRTNTQTGVLFTIINTYQPPTPTPVPTVTPTPTTPPLVTPTPTATRGTPRYVTLLDLDVPLGVGASLNFGDCFD